jgi:hypothetical protein
MQRRGEQKQNRRTADIELQEGKQTFDIKIYQLLL